MSSSNKPPLSGLVTTETTVLQKQTERECQPYLVDLTTLPDDQKAHLAKIGLFREDLNDISNGKEWVRLLREKHRSYLEGVWKRPLKAPFVSLDSSRPWMLYWCLHGYDLLNSSNDDDSCWISDTEGSCMISTLEDCWEGYHTPKSQTPKILSQDDPFYYREHEDDDDDDENDGYYCGGFGGGPGQMAHAATTYAAVLALCILATEDSNNNNNGNDDYHSLHYSQRARRILSEIRIPLYRWMVSLQVPETGGYRMQHDGEVDVRATYTIACCSKLLGLLEESDYNSKFTVLGRPEVIRFVKSCQTYEGGMGGEPFSEAHGGYTFCAVAALKLLGALHNDNTDSFDVSALLGWLGRRQMSYEGGFSGRSNKLVDGCYSFWQGGAVAIASSCSEYLASEDTETSDDDPWLARYREQQTTTASAALPFPLLYDVFLLERYILLCAQEVTGGLRDKPSKPRDFYHTCYNLSGLSVAQHSSSNIDIGFGDPQQTLVGHTHPCYNIRIDRVASILEINWDDKK